MSISSNHMSNLLSGEQIKVNLSKDFQCARNITIVSAYITHPAVKWLMKNISSSGLDPSVTIVSRVSLLDIMSGSTSLEALRECVDIGWGVYSLHSLHAKIYVIDDDKMYVGSSNFTTRGLKIFGEGNLEALVQISPNKNDLEFVNNIVLSSVLIDKDILSKMEEYVSTLGKNSDTDLLDRWPENILPEDNGLWVSDFPLLSPDSANIDDEFGDLFNSIKLGDKSFENKQKLRRTKAYVWLLTVLQDEECNECYFGRLTAKLHDALNDDPGPYRKDVKQLLSNLLEFIKIVSLDEIVIDRPNHSQRVRLLVK